MLRGSQRNPGPPPSRSVLRLRPTEGKGVSEVPVGIIVALRFFHGGPLTVFPGSHTQSGSLARLEGAPERLEHQQWPQVVALLLSEGGTRPRPGSRPPSGPVAGLQLLQAWTGQVRYWVRGPVQAPGEGPAPTLTATWRVARAGAHRRLRGSTLGAQEQEPGISGCRKPSCPSQKISALGTGRVAPRPWRGRKLTSHLPWVPACDTGSGAWVTKVTPGLTPGPPLLSQPSSWWSWLRAHAHPVICP